jgi:hypothetical protein
LFTNQPPERLRELDNGWSLRKPQQSAPQLRCNEGPESITVDWGRAETEEAPANGSVQRHSFAASSGAAAPRENGA